MSAALAGIAKIPTTSITATSREINFLAVIVASFLLVEQANCPLRFCRAPNTAWAILRLANHGDGVKRGFVKME